MTELSYVAVPLLLLALLFVVLPLFARRSEEEDQPSESERKQANVRLFKQRMAELETEFSLGEYDEAEMARLKTDLERRLLDDVASIEAQGRSSKLPKGLAVAVLAFVPVASWLLYGKIGAADDLLIKDTYTKLQHAGSREEAGALMQTLVVQLDQQLKGGSDNPHYLMLLGRSQMQLQNYPAAADAFQRLMVQTGEDPIVMGSYTQALYLAANRTLTDQVKRLADRTLELQPFNSTVLGMMGMASYEEGNFAGAVDYWQRLLRVLDPESDNARMIQQGIDQAKLKLAEIGGEAPVESPTVDVAEVQVDVSLAKGLSAAPGDSVFVFARAINGPRMPLAVARLQVSQLPAQVRLDDTMAMAPGLTLSSFDEVEVVARISKRGIANPGPGGLEGKSSPLKPKEHSGTVAVSIASVLK